jgi:CRISPR-associated protein Cas1
MPVAYVTEPGAVVHVNGGSLYVRKDGKALADWEIVHTEALWLCGGTHITHPAMRALLKAGVEVALLDRQGRMLGRLSPLNAKNAALRFEQYRCLDSQDRRLALSRDLVRAKVGNARAVLLRYMRNHPGADLNPAAAELEEAVRATAQAPSLSSLMGLEGNAARVYFGVFGRMCRGPLQFNGRSTRPPQDPVNALLSLGYTFLVNDLTSMLGATGFDPCIGFYHDLAAGRPSLALDHAEPLRTGLIDAFVLYLVNNRVFTAEDFEPREGGCYLTRCGLKNFVRQYQRLLLRKRLNRLSDKRETIRRHLQLQGERFARALASGSSMVWYSAQD